MGEQHQQASVNENATLFPLVKRKHFQATLKSTTWLSPAEWVKKEKREKREQK